MSIPHIVRRRVCAIRPTSRPTKVGNVGAVKHGRTRPGGRPASAVRWRREASTDHSHEGGADTVDAFPFTLQDHGPRHPRRVAATYGACSTPKLRNTRGTSCFAVLVDHVPAAGP